MFSKKAIIIIAIVFFIIGFMVSLLIFNEKPVLPDPNNTFQAGWQAAKQRLDETGVANTINPELEINSLSGTIEAIQGDNITIKIIPIDPLADPDLDNRIAEIDGSTKLYQLIRKDEQLYQQELAEFYNNNNNLGADFTANPPLNYVKQEIFASDLRLAQQVVVQARTSNIREIKQFKAAEITVQY